MSEINNSGKVSILKREIAVRTLYPEAIHDYRPEDEHTQHINQLKQELQDLGVDAETFQKETVAHHFGIQIVDKVIQIDFPQQAS
jgi:hypothetical protein